MKNEADVVTKIDKLGEEQEKSVNKLNEKVTPNTWFRKTVVLGSIGASIIAFLGLLGYIPGLQVLGSIRMSYIPMAPSTAVCFFILSAVLFYCGQKSRQGFVFKFMGILPLFVMTFGVLEVAGSFIGVNLTFEDRLFSGAGTLGGIPIGRMSPVTGVVFIVAGLGIFIMLRSLNSRHARRLGDWASSLGTLVVLIGTTVLLGYMYGTPFLYGGTIVPMAATAAIAFILLGDALVAAVGPESFPLNQVTGHSTSARLLRVFFPVMVVIVFVQSVLSRLISVFSIGNDALLVATLIIIMGIVMAFVIDRVTHFMGFNLDELKRNLQESEERYRALYFNSKDSIMVLTPEKGFTAGNPATVKLFGCRDEKDFTSHSPADLSPKYQPDGALSTVKAQEMMEMAMKNGSNFFEWTHQRASGEVFPATVLLSRLEVDGKLVLQATVRDVSSQNRIEQKLQESEQRYKFLLNSVPLCIKWFDSSGNLISVNQHAREEHFLMGKSDEEIKNWPYMSCIGESYHEQVKRGMRLAFSGKTSSFELEHVPGTSTGRWCFSSLVPVLDLNGKVTMVLFISRDITKEKEAKAGEQKNIAEMTKLNQLMVGRELKMVELKKELQKLKNLQESEVVKKPE